MNVSGLAEELGQEQSMISHNLKMLERCKLVFSERRGKEKYVWSNDESVKAMFSIVKHHGEHFCVNPENCPFSD